MEISARWPADMRRRRENEEEVMLWLHLTTVTLKWMRKYMEIHGNSHRMDI